MKLTTSEVVKKPNNLSFSDYTLRCNQQTKKNDFGYLCIIPYELQLVTV